MRFFCLFLGCFLFGYSVAPYGCVLVDGYQGVVPNQFLEIVKMNKFRNDVKNAFAENKDFHITCDENNLLESDQNFLLPYKGVRITIHLPNLEEDKVYCLWCPNIGAPSNPERILGMLREGNDIILINIGENINPDFLMHSSDRITLDHPMSFVVYANPGFCSDWYLISNQAILHTVFIYKPITTSLTTGETVQFDKKECGGNFVEIFLKNFPKNTDVVMESSFGRDQVFTTDEQGRGYMTCANFPFLQPDKTKGVGQIKLLWDGHCLETSVEWDKSTLDIKRVQPQGPLMTENWTK